MSDYFHWDEDAKAVRFTFSFGLPRIVEVLTPDGEEIRLLERGFRDGEEVETARDAARRIVRERRKEFNAALVVGLNTALGRP